MLDSPTKFKRIFNFEISRGFDNRAVLGGLVKILPTLLEYLTTLGFPKIKLLEIDRMLTDYAGMSLEDRKSTIEIILTHFPFDDVSEKIDIQSESSSSSNQISLSDPIFSSSLEIIQGVGPQTSKSLAKLGLHNLRDLLSHYPRRYDDFSQLKTINQLKIGEESTIIATILSSHLHEAKNRRIQIMESVVSDTTGSLRIIWFNQPWLRNQLIKGKQIVISGKVDVYKGRHVINNPDWEELEKEHLHTNRIVPIYASSSGISQKNLRRVMYKTISFWPPRLKDPLPGWVIEKEKLINFSSALSQIHFPDTQVLLRKAKERLSFDEILLLQVAVFQQKQRWSNLKSRGFSINDDILNHKIESLPFPLTLAQTRAINTIRDDLSKPIPMHRLVQGDVGSGKTVVASLSMEIILFNGSQTVLMAPTSILAEQHYRTLKTLLVDRNVLSANQIAILQGSTPVKEKKEIYHRISIGEIRLIIGTHALLQDPVEFSDLQLIVIDEQHRFGVSQRAILRSKANNPHILVLTATPIPRSLSLTLYGDLDVSIIDQMPAGRKMIDTRLYSPAEREEVYSLVMKEIQSGHQAFFVYPLIEDDDIESNKSVLSEITRLKNNIFQSLRLELLHGRMKSVEKEKVLSAFRDGNIDILVSTTVIEVGMDIPNATVVVIESANRFGLAQLHQIRGRVGRGEAQSYCLLIAENDDVLGNERLSIMVRTNDGFELAEYDLKQRGPGDFLGKRQSGFWGMKLTNIADVRMIERARDVAKEILNQDPELMSPDYELLRHEVVRAIPEHFGERS